MPISSGPRPLDLLVGAVLIAIFAYELGFNLLPSNIRLSIAAALAGGIAFLSVAWLFANPRIWRVIIFTLLLTIASFWLMGEASGEGTFNPTIGIRFLIPLFFAHWIIEVRRSIYFRLVYYLTILTLSFSIFYAVL